MIDKRVIERQIRKGKLDQQAHRRSLEALPDVSDRVARDTVVEQPQQQPSRSQESSVSSSEPQRAPEAPSETRAPEVATSPDAAASY